MTDARKILMAAFQSAGTAILHDRQPEEDLLTAFAPPHI
jgi:hypothetical protein